MRFDVPEYIIINGRVKKAKDSEKTNKYHITPKSNAGACEAITPLLEGDYIIRAIDCTETSDWFFMVKGKKMGYGLEHYLFEPIFEN